MGDKEVEISQVVEDEEKTTSVVRTPIFHKTYATNLSVSKTDSDFRIELFNEKFETEEESVYHSDGVVILTHQAAKKLLFKLTDIINDYEEENGEIIVSKERMNCS